MNTQKYPAIFLFIPSERLFGQNSAEHLNILWSGYSSNVTPSDKWSVNFDGQVRFREI